MRIDIEPTPELYEAPINGAHVPVRIWKGFTDNGAAIEAYVLSITPNTSEDGAKLKSALPFFMVRSQQMYQVADYEKDKPDA